MVNHFFTIDNKVSNIDNIYRGLLIGKLKKVGGSIVSRFNSYFVNQIDYKNKYYHCLMDNDYNMYHEIYTLYDSKPENIITQIVYGKDEYEHTLIKAGDSQRPKIYVHMDNKYYIHSNDGYVDNMYFSLGIIDCEWKDNKKLNNICLNFIEIDNNIIKYGNNIIQYIKFSNDNQPSKKYHEIVDQLKITIETESDNIYKQETHSKGYVYFTDSSTFEIVLLTHNMYMNYLKMNIYIDSFGKLGNRIVPNIYKKINTDDGNKNYIPLFYHKPQLDNEDR